MLWSGVIFVVGGWALSSIFRSTVEGAFESRLSGLLESLVAASEIDQHGALRLRRPLGDPRFDEPFSGWYWQINGPGERVMKSRSLFDRSLPARSTGKGRAKTIIGPEGQSLRLIARDIYFPEIEAPLRYSVAADLSEVSRQVGRFNGILTWSLGLLGAGLALAIILQIRFGLRPLGRIREQLSEIRLGRAQRLDGKFPTEIAPLADELNALLDHNATMIDRARTHVGNLAHALKTPLSVLSNDAARFDGPLADSVRKQVALMRRHVDRHLARARAAGTGGDMASYTPVRPVLDGLVRTLARIFQGKGIEIAAEVGPGVAFRGEKQDLEEILGNVLENACKWSAARAAIQISEGDGRLVAVVDDDGPGVPAAQFDRLLHRGERLDESVQGSGLGLSITYDLVKLYLGDISFEASPLGGLRVVLTLPAVSEPAGNSRLPAPDRS